MGQVGMRWWAEDGPIIEVLEARLLLDATTAQQAIELFHTTPAVFIENQGHWADESVRFVHRGQGANIAHTDSGPVFELFREVASNEDDGEAPATPAASPHGDPGAEPAELERLRFSATFDGANAVTPVGLAEAQTRFNFLLGDPSAWRENVPSYEIVAYEGLYDGIDLHTWGRRDHLKYEFHVAPGADFSQIRVSYSGIDALTIDEAGALHVRLPGDWGEVVDDAPYIYQVVGGEQVEVPGAYRLVDGNTYAFEITGDYDPARQLVIDPEVDWSSYLGGSSNDYGYGIATDSAGNVLVTGSTYSAGWVSGGWDTIFNGDEDAFVVKLSATGGHLWSTYLGGSSFDGGWGIAADAAGNALVSGYTDSSGWVSGGWDTSLGGNWDGFVVKLSASGGHLWSSYVGGSGADAAYGIAADAAGNALVTGETYSAGWVSEGWDTSLDGYDDAFVVKLSASGGHLWSTYLGGSEYEWGYGVAADAAGNVLVTGETESSGWVSGGWDTSYNGGSGDGFVVRLGASGGHLWSSYLGGSDWDSGFGIAADAAGNALVTGRTDSPGWVSGGLDTSLGGLQDGFVVKLSASGGHLWSSYVGGSSDDRGYGIATDAAGNPLVTGETYSAGWVSGGWDTSLDGSADAFVVKLSASGGHLWSSYLGGSSSDYGYGIAAGASGNVLVTGRTGSSGWVSGGWDTSYGGGGDGFVAKIRPALRDWTVMVFSNGDNNLEVTAIGNLDQMEQVDLRNVSAACVVQIDRSATDAGLGYTGALVPSTDTSGGNWSDTRRGSVRFDGVMWTYSTALSPAIASQPELNMGDDATLINFVQWATDVAPARHYALVLLGHGEGWRGCSHDYDPGGYLRMDELRDAFDAIGHVDVLALHMCVMQMAEVATEVIGEADYLVAAEDALWGARFDYDGWLGWLSGHTDATAEQLAVRIFEEDDDPTLSVLDLSRVPTLNDTVATFAQVALDSATQTDWEYLRDARTQADEFQYSSYRDLQQYMDAVAADTAISAALRTAAEAVSAQVEQVVVRAKGRGEGLSIYLPVGGASVDEGYNGSALTFCKQEDADGTRWGDFIRHLPDAAWTASWDSDWGETMSGSQVIDADAGQPATAASAVENASDVDFVTFTASAGDVLNAEITGNAGADGLFPVLTLYAPDQVTVLAQAQADADGVARIERQPLEAKGDYFLAVTGEGNLDPLNPVPGGGTGSYSLTIVWDQPENLQPQISVAVAVDFGTVETWTWGEGGIELTNTGGGSLEILDVVLPADSPFAAPYPPVPLPATIEPGESMLLPVAVYPTALGAISETLHIISNDATSPDVTVELLAEGIDTTPPTAGAWHSSSEHAEGVGEALLEIPDDGAFCEPRTAGVTRLVIEFSEAVDAASFTPGSVRLAGNDQAGDPVDLSGIVTSTSTTNGDTVAVIELTPALPDVGRYIVQIEGVMDLAGNPLAGDNNRVFTAMAGDATGDLRVNAIDLSYIWPRRTTLIDGVSADQTRSDVTCDGRINAIDLSAAWPRRGADMRDVPDPVLASAGGGSRGAVGSEGLAAAAWVEARRGEGDRVDALEQSDPGRAGPGRLDSMTPRAALCCRRRAEVRDAVGARRTRSDDAVAVSLAETLPALGLGEELLDGRLDVLALPDLRVLKES